MKSRLFAAALILLLAGVLPAADSQLLNLTIPGATVIAGANIQQASTSPFGQYILAQLPVNDPHFQEFLNLTGFDPRTDISEVLASSTGQAGPNSGLVAVRGRFDVARIVQAATSKSQGEVKVEQYQGAQILSGPKGPWAVAFLDSTFAVAGNADLVRAAIDRRSTNSLDTAVAAKVNQLGAANDVWAVSLVPLPMHKAGNLPANFEPLQHIQQSSGGVKFGANVQVSAEAVEDTSQAASALADVLRGLVALAQLNSNAQSPDVMAILRSLQIQAQGTSLKVSLTIPEDQIERLIQLRHGGAHVRKVARTEPRQ